MDVESALLSHEPAVRFGAYLCILAIMALWEIAAPRRATSVSKARRWTSNLGLAAINTILLRALFPFAALGVASFVKGNGWGVLDYLGLPFWPAVAVTVIALDFVVWTQHVVFHAVPALWRLHRVHHADLDCDVTTGSRFHPIEMLLSALVKCAAILVLGPPVLAVLLFEVLLNATSMFNHSNVRLPPGLDRALRWVIVTPDMHRVHHSIEADETNSNFGFNLPWWDRLLGTYRQQPRAGHQAMTIGIAGHRDAREVESLTGMLLLPFRGPDGGDTDL